MRLRHGLLPLLAVVLVTITAVRARPKTRSFCP
jgi:hypothetical protein